GPRHHVPPPPPLTPPPTEPLKPLDPVAPGAGADTAPSAAAVNRVTSVPSPPAAQNGTGPVYQDGSGTDRPAAAASPTTRAHRSARPNAIAHGRWRLNRSRSSSSRSPSASAVARCRRNASASARTALPAAVRTGTARVVTSIAIPVTTSGRPTSAHDVSVASTAVTEMPSARRSG